MILRILVIAVAVGAASPAHGQPAPAPPPDDQDARELYQEGDRLYAEGRYEEALAKFGKAFELSGRPILLFNLANAHERVGHYAQAADALRRYLPDAQPDEKVALRKRVARLDQRAAAAKTDRDTRARDLEELTVLRAKTCPVCKVEPPPEASRVLSYSLIGTGTIALTSGIVFGAVARGANGDAADECIDDDGVRLCSSAAKGALDRERRFSLLADVSVGVGVVATGAGLYLLWRARRSDEATERRTAVVPAIGPDWAGVSVAGSF